MAGVSGRSGGARVGAGGARPGAGRPRKHPLIVQPSPRAPVICRCGKEVEQTSTRGRQRKYCSTECRKAHFYRYDSVSVPTPPCRTCAQPVDRFFKTGKPFTQCQACAHKVAAARKADRSSQTCAYCCGTFAAPSLRKYCSDKCNGAAQNRKRCRPMEEYQASRRNPANWFKCEHCGKDAHRKMSGTNTGPNRWCSMQCRMDAAAAVRPAPFSICYGLHCKTCNKPFVSRRVKSNCSRACELREFREASRDMALAIHRAAAKVIACERCKTEFCPLYGASHASLCRPCAVEQVREMRRIAKLKREALERGVNAERVDPFKVFARDKWRCKLCGRATPKSKRGTYEDDAPELDHIVPLARGGAHTYLNTQCACRRCNGLKSDKPLGQLLLIG